MTVRDLKFQKIVDSVLKKFNGAVLLWGPQQSWLEAK